MTEPTVCCVMLVNGREAMVKRAIASFRSQTYERKRLLIVASDLSDNGLPVAILAQELSDNGLPVGRLELLESVCNDGDHLYRLFDPQSMEMQANVMPARYPTVGALRNFAGIGAEAMGAELIAHFDSDDWSHPLRLEEQVSVLQRRPAIDCVGYNRALFWDTTPGRFAGAWEFVHGNSSYVLGASMMYRTEAWRDLPFSESADVHEDYDWWVHNSLRCLGMSSLRVPIGDPLQMAPKCEPRIICSIHGANTSDAYALSKRKSPGWERAEEWDGFCMEAMKL